MSIVLVTAAFKAPLPSTQKFVLVALCDSANDQGECYPSVSALAEKCSLGERTVQEAIHALEASGHVRREFRKGRSTTYWVEPTSAVAAPLGRASRTPAAAAPPQQPHPTPAAAAPPPPQQPHPTPAAAAPITVKEPSEEPSGNRKKTARALAVDRPDDVAEQTWRDWCAHRKGKHATVSETVVSVAREESVKAGMTLDEFLRAWVASGYQGFKADWIKPQQRASPGRPGQRTQAEIDAINARSTEEARQLLFGPRSQEIIDA